MNNDVNIEQLGRDYVAKKELAKAKKKAAKAKRKQTHSVISSSHRPFWMKAVAFALVGTVEVGVSTARAGVEVGREVKHQRTIRAGKRAYADIVHEEHMIEYDKQLQGE